MMGALGRLANRIKEAGLRPELPKQVLEGGGLNVLKFYGAGQNRKERRRQKAALLKAMMKGGPR